MSSRPRQLATRKKEQGYILITLILFVALLAISMAILAPAISQQIKRDREEELIHRGVQYSRAIQHFVKKTGRYPTTIEELESTNNLRFLRKRYKDPITGKDFKILRMGDVQMSFGAGIQGAIPIANLAAGAAAAGGQGGGFGSNIFASSGFGNNNALGGNSPSGSSGGSGFGGGFSGGGGFGGASPGGGFGAQGGNGFGSSPFGNQGGFSGNNQSGDGGNQNSGGFGSPGGFGGQNGFGQNGLGNQGGFGGQSGFGSQSGVGNPQNNPGTPDQGQNQQQGANSQNSGDSNNKVFGGGPIVGVASISKDKTIRVFSKKDKYNQWQFIYDPSTDRGGLLMTPNQPGLQGMAQGALAPNTTGTQNSQGSFTFQGPSGSPQNGQQPVPVEQQSPYPPVPQQPQSPQNQFPPEQNPQ